MKFRELLVLLFVLALILFLPSCKALQGVPVRIGIQTPNGALGYSSKSGLSVDATVPARRAIRVSREK